MTTQLRIDMFDAGPGDAFVVSADRDGRRTVIVIDGGPPGTPGRGMPSHLTRLGGGIRASVDLLAVTHLDNDHIGGAIDLAERALTPTAGVPLLDITAAWHNSFDELVGPAYSRHGGNFSTKVSSLLRGWSADHETARDGLALIASVGQGQALSLVGFSGNRGCPATRPSVG